MKDNTALFDKQVVKNLVDSLEECETKKKIKMSTSRSLDSFEVFDQELHTFDCQGGSEELCEDTKSEDISLDLTEDAFDNESEESEKNISDHHENLNRIREIASAPWNRNNFGTVPTMSNGRPKNIVIFEETVLSRRTAVFAEGSAELGHIGDSITNNAINDMVSDATNIVIFYITEIDEGAHSTMRQILQSALEFWIEHCLSMQKLEKVLLEHINKLYYPLGLLLFW